MRRLVLASLLVLWTSAVSAQFATIGPTPPAADNGDRLATTAWVNNFLLGNLPLANGKILIGSAGGLAVAQTPSGDCSFTNLGVVTCTGTGGVAFGALATLGAGTGLGSSGGNLNLQPAAASTIGGVESYVAVAHQWINSISTAGVPSSAQPGFADISGFLSSTQFPALSGDITTSAGSVATALAVVNANAGTFGSATTCITTTQNAKGLTTAISAATCTPAIGSVTGLGTNVATALGVNVGTAGAFVVNGGALGSPSSAGIFPAFTLGGTVSGGGHNINNVIISGLVGPSYYLTGNWYQGLLYGGLVSGAAMTANTAYCFYSMVTAPVTIKKLGAALSTGVTSGLTQFAVYSQSGGTLTLVDHTGDTTATVAAQGPINNTLANTTDTLNPGTLYAFCTNSNGATVFFARNAVGADQLSFVGSSSQTGTSSIALSGRSIAMTYGTWSSPITESGMADVTTSITPNIQFQVN